MKDCLKRLLDPVIAMATVANICTILATLGVVGDVQTDTITKVATSIIAILLQLGIMKQPNSTK